MEQNRIAPELLVMRSIACMVVVLLHAISMVLMYNASLAPGPRQTLNIASALLLFSTPTFAFMSAFLIGLSKRQQSAALILLHRVKHLLLPFLFGALLYAVWGSYNWHFPVLERLVYNLRGGYHGYFVLVVIQFYLAHALLGRFLARLSPWYAVVGAGVINFVFLLGLNLSWFTLPNLGFSWYHTLPAWSLHYVMGFYAGRNREAFQESLRKHLPWGVALLVASGTVMLYLIISGMLPGLSSQRFDVLVYAAGVIVVAFPLAGKISRVPALLTVVSRASFGIYMLHWFFLELFGGSLTDSSTCPRQ